MAEAVNILLILTDQHRLSAVGAYGPTPCRTPNIDRLAREGVRFENAYTACPVCSPARATVITGLFPHSHGICCNVGDLGCSVNELKDGPKLLSRKLQKAGYLLGYSGKWHLGTDKTALYGHRTQRSLPKDVGFDGHNFPGHGGGGFNFPEYQRYLADNGFEHRVKPWAEETYDFGGVGELQGPTESTVPYFLAENTLSLMRRFSGQERPFFIWHNFWGPHGPYYTTKEYVELYRDVEIPPWPNYDWPSRSMDGPHNVVVHPMHERLKWADWEMAIRYYYGFTSLIDSQIGRIVEHLDRSGLLDNTVIIFSADHGESLGSHGGLVDKGWRHFEEIQCIPLIVRFPKGQFQGKVVTELVSLADLYPTILELAGGDAVGADIHGVSLLGLVDGSELRWRDTVVVEFDGLNNMAYTQRTVRYQNYKFGFNCGSADELYDLAADPHETNNLIGQAGYGQVVKDFRGRLRQWMEETGDPALYLYDRMSHW